MEIGKKCVHENEGLTVGSGKCRTQTCETKLQMKFTLQHFSYYLKLESSQAQTCTCHQQEVPTPCTC